jgi:hypothetical protein
MKLLRLLSIFLVVASSFGQPTQHYQVAVIVGVKPHQTTADNASDPAKYDVSLQVGDTTYVVLYTPQLGVGTVKYAEGRNLLVLVGEKTISYNDLLGQSFEVPIISRKATTDATQPK